MRPDIFSKDDSVLLLGEGNFSFSLGLLNLGLQLKLTSTCFESVLTENQNVSSQILKSHGEFLSVNVFKTFIKSISLT